MTEASSEQQDTRSRHVEPHPVAKLLTPEMRARVRAATFGVSGYGISDVGTLRCPLAVACGLPTSRSSAILQQLVPDGDPEHRAIVLELMDWLDTREPGQSDPADVYALLGCEEPAP